MNIKKLLPIVLVTALTSCSNGIGSEIDSQKAWVRAEAIEEDAATMYSGEKNPYIGIVAKMNQKTVAVTELGDGTLLKETETYKTTIEFNAHGDTHSKIEYNYKDGERSASRKTEYCEIADKEGNRTFYVKDFNSITTKTEKLTEKLAFNDSSADYERKKETYTRIGDRSFNILTRYMSPSYIMNHYDPKASYHASASIPLEASYYSNGKANLTIKANLKKIDSSTSEFYYADLTIYRLVAKYNKNFLTSVEETYSFSDGNSNTYNAKVRIKKSLKIKLPSDYKKYLQD